MYYTSQEVFSHENFSPLRSFLFFWGEFRKTPLQLAVLGLYSFDKKMNFEVYLISLQSNFVTVKTFKMYPNTLEMLQKFAYKISIFLRNP